MNLICLLLPQLKERANGIRGLLTGGALYRCAQPLIKLLFLLGFSSFEWVKGGGTANEAKQQEGKSKLINH